MLVDAATQTSSVLPEVDCPGASVCAQQPAGQDTNTDIPVDDTQALSAQQSQVKTSEELLCCSTIS